MWEPELEELGLDVEAKAQFGPWKLVRCVSSCKSIPTYMHSSRNFSTCEHLMSYKKLDAYLVHLALSPLLAAEQLGWIFAVPEGRALLVLGTQEEPLILYGP
jgi:hypothetical protein